jgi:DNA replication protein DnaC
VGKTQLAVTLGIRAIELGFSVGFYRFDDLIHDLKNEADVPPTRVKSQKYLRNSLLIIDEVGYRDLTRQEESRFSGWYRCATKRAERSARRTRRSRTGPRSSPATRSW